jgi:hypothetical protein
MVGLIHRLYNSHIQHGHGSLLVDVQATVDDNRFKVCWMINLQPRMNMDKRELAPRNQRKGTSEASYYPSTSSPCHPL